MRYYYVDDLTLEEQKKIQEALRLLECKGSLEGMHWLSVPAHFFSDIQKEHQHTCGPYIMGLEVEHTLVKLELLVRARNCLRCACVHYASPELQAHMIHYVDTLLSEYTPS